MSLEEIISAEKSIIESHTLMARAYHLNNDCYRNQEEIELGEAEHHKQLVEFLEELRELKNTTTEEKIKALGVELRLFRKNIIDEKALIGFNMAVAICNKYLGESNNEILNTGLKEGE